MFKRLSELGQAKLKNPDSTDLTEYIDELDINLIISTIIERLSSAEAPQALNYVFLGFSEQKTSQKKRLKLCTAIIKEIHSSNSSNRSYVALTSRIAQELNKFPTSHLVSLAETCIDFIRSSTSSSQTHWKDLLPKVLSEVESHSEVEYAGAESSGFEFKQRIIQLICSMKWNKNIITSLAAMFIDINLSDDEHLQVVNKLCSNFDKMPPQEIPPLIHQMLILCKNIHGIIVILTLQKYFNSNIYKKKEIAVDNITEISESDDKELSDCESMVMYHIEESAKMSRGCITHLIKFSKACSNTPEVVLEPFLLSVLLSMSTIPAYEHQLIDVLKNTILRSAQEEERRQQSAWLRLMVPSQNDFNRVLVLIIQSKISLRDKVLNGLVSFSMSLLNIVPTKGKESAAEVLWNYGKHSLVYIVKCHRQVASTLLQTLADHIITGKDSKQYADCLVKLCSAAPLVVVDNLPNLLRLLDFLGQLPTAIAHRVITAILSVVRISNKIRDSFILVLRKALFSREIDTRKIAVIGFLQLLKVLKVSGLSALSQSENTFSGPSVFTQICMDIHSQGNTSNSSSNEAICLEVLGVLRRCFMQQSTVKLCFYKGLYDALCRNPELCPYVLDTLLDHFNHFYQTDETVLPPLNLDNSVSFQEGTIVLQEPLGELVFVMQQVCLKTLEVCGQNDMPRSLEKLMSILDSLVSRYSQCDLIHFGLDEEFNILDTSPETRKMQQVVCQTICVYQALSAYTVCGWTPECDERQGQKLINLFKAYNILLEYIKNSKVAKKDKDNGGGVKEKNKNVPATKMAMFKQPETVVNLTTVYRFLTLFLSDDVPWATEISLGDVRERRPLFRYVAQMSLEVIQLFKSKVSLSKLSSMIKSVVDVARLLYERCLKRYNEIAEFDRDGSVLLVECLYELLTILFDNFRQVTPILAEIVNIGLDKDLPHQLKPLIKSFQLLLVESVGQDDVEDEDTSDKQLLNVVINSLTILVDHLPPDNPITTKVLDWLIDFAQKRSLPTLPLTKSYMTFLLAMVCKCRAEPSLPDSIAIQLTHLLGSINEAEVEESPLSLSMVNETTKLIVLPILCSNIYTSLDQIEWMLGRLQAQVGSINVSVVHGGSPRSRKEAIVREEKNIVHQLCHCINVIQSISCIAVPPGPCTVAVFRLLSHSYTTLSALTKYFVTKCSPQDLDYQEARFSKLVRLAGSHLTSQVADLILYVEDSNKNETNKKTKEAQVLCQARKQAVFIPKLVADMENFSKAVTLLSRKCKDESLTSNMKLTTTRDFRINTKKLQEVMQRSQEVESEDEDMNNIQHQSSQVNVSIVQDREYNSQSVVVSQSQVNKENMLQPPMKKMRTK